MRSLFLSTATATVLYLASAPHVVAAQVVTPTGQQIAPGRDELRQNLPTAAPGGGRLTIESDIERAPCALDAPSYAHIRVGIREAQFNNLQGVDPAELREAYASLLGEDRPIATICAIRDVAATVLRRKGYLAAVLVPIQRIENGVVRFEVLYAKLVAVRVRGDAGRSESLLASYLSHLTREPVFNRFVAERYLLLARDLPGHDVRLALKPAGGAPGELIGEVSVIRTPLQLDAAIQNYAARTTGRWTGALQAQAFGLLGGDRLFASVSSSLDFREQQLVQLGYERRFGGEGLTLAGSFTYAWSEPDVVFPNDPSARLTARTLFATGEARYPIVRTQRFSVLGAAGLDFVDQDVRIKGIDFTRDRLRVGFLRLDMDAAGMAERRAPRWRASASVEFRQGLDLFGASGRAPVPLPPGYVPPARFIGDPTSTLVRASAAFEHALGGGFWVAAMPRAQYAFTPLFGFEQFSGGNFTVGRGYDPASIIGDTGVGGAIELRLPRVQPFAGANLAVLPYAFADAAWAWNKRAAASNPDNLVSVGAGLRAVLNDRFRIDGTLAVPLRAAGPRTRRPDPRFLLSLTTRLWPWGK